MLKRVIFIPIVVISAILSGSALAGETLPSLPVETLSGKHLTLPTDLSSDPHLFIIGFSRASQKQTSEWLHRTLDEYGKSGVFAIYQVAVLDVPRFIRGFAIDGMRSGVPKQLHEQFLLATQKVDDWKRLATFAQPDSAYLVLVNGRHEITWRGVGALSDTNFQILTKQLKVLGLDQEGQQVAPADGPAAPAHR